jgi:hypothetical protein
MRLLHDTFIAPNWAARRDEVGLTHILTAELPPLAALKCLLQCTAGRQMWAANGKSSMLAIRCCNNINMLSLMRGMSLPIRCNTTQEQHVITIHMYVVYGTVHWHMLSIFMCLLYRLVLR